MNFYRVNHLLVPYLPDGHLTMNVYDPEAILHGGRVQGLYLEGHMSPPFVRDLDEFHRHVARCGLLVPGGANEDFTVEFVRVAVEHLPLMTMDVRTGIEHRTRWLEIRVREDMVSKELIKELNEWSIPHYRGMDQG